MPFPSGVGRSFIGGFLRFQSSGDGRLGVNYHRAALRQADNQIRAVLAGLERRLFRKIAVGGHIRHFNHFPQLHLPPMSHLTHIRQCRGQLAGRRGQGLALLSQRLDLRVQLAVVFRQRLNQFLKLTMPLLELPLGLLHSLAQVLVSQLEKLLVVPLQGFGRRQLGRLAELSLGLLQQLLSGSGLFQLAVQPGNFRLLISLLLARPSTADHPAAGNPNNRANQQPDNQCHGFHINPSPLSVIWAGL